MVRPDLIVTDRTGAPILLAEVKSLRDVSADEAAEYRANLFGQWSFPEAKYFLFVTPQRGFLWSTDPSEVNPISEFPMDDVLETYQVPNEAVRGSVFEAVVQHFLRDLTWGGRQQSTRAEAALVEAGVRDAVDGGDVSSDDSPFPWSPTSRRTSS